MGCGYFFTRHFHPYLVAQCFLLHTDHGSLTWLQNFHERQLAQWLEQLQELDFEIVHRKRRKHTKADALSRLPCQQCGRDSHFSPIPTSQISVMTMKVSQIPGVLSIREEQLADPSLGMILRRKEADQKQSLDRKCVSRSNIS